MVNLLTVSVMGASAAGKSLLLQTLSGRVQDLALSGEVKMNDKIVNPKRLDNPVAYVPQEDSLIGELTAREVTMNTAVLKRNDPLPVIKEETSQLLDSLGLTKVADGIIGTMIFRGLSGGQKKRVEISTELIASPSILLLDEPTSGLDSSIAYDVLLAVRNLVKGSGGKLSVILTIHQPNSKILDLFDHLLLLNQGASVYFGTVLQSLAYFSGLGYPCPKSVTPTDYFLQISDSNFTSAAHFDFERAYLESAIYTELKMTLHPSALSASTIPEEAKGVTSQVGTSFWRQFYTLVYREYALAWRDPTLYYLQVVLILGFAFCVGAVFLALPQGIDGNFNIFYGAILWVSLLFGWVHAFKVYHVSKVDKRTQHEIANNKYTALAIFAADWFSTATLGLVFLPSAPIAYFMAGFPGAAFPYLILNCWVVSTCISHLHIIAYIFNNSIYYTYRPLWLPRRCCR